jgi:hypothetical protein
MTGKSDNLRYSIIPARAITDPGITAQALRVLALLGRHTDDNGWCRRSQVRMAKELGCSRGTVQNALDLLIGQENGTGYIERREETRLGVEPEEGRHPHCSYSYRVRLDLDDQDRVSRANRLAGVRASQIAPSANPEQHPVPVSLAPLTEPSPCEPSPLEPSAREKLKPEWAKVWQAFKTWPGLPAGASEHRTRAAWERVENLLPADIVGRIRAHGDTIRRQNALRGRAGGLLVTHPHNWLERDRGWEAYPTEDIQEIEYDRSWGDTAEKLKAAIGPKNFDAYFATGRFESGPPPRISFPRPILCQLAKEKFPRQLEKCFGGEVILEVAA